MDFDEYDYLERAVERVKDGRWKGEEGDHREEQRSKRMRGHEESRDRDGREKGDGSSSKRDRDRSEREERDGRRHRELDRERSHSKSRDVDRQKDRERYREKEATVKDHRPSREKRDKKEQPMNEPEADPERDQRTVFAYQICLKADERDVYEFFSKAGKVRDVRLIMDRMTRRSKGVGYVEFYDAMSVPMAIAMSGQLLHGLPVMVKPSEAEKNLAQSTATGGAGGYVTPYSGGARRLYVGNLHFNITEDQLRQVFEPFGVVELVQLPTDPETGQCKGFGFVQYAKLEDARVAQQALNGVLQLAGRMIKVSSITEQFGMQDIGGAAGELDDDEGGGLSLTAQSRALLMQKLDRTGTVSNFAAAATVPVINPNVGLLAPGGNGIRPTLGLMGLPSTAGVLNAGLTTATLNAAAVEPVGAPTDCLLLRNMFDPKTETEPDFDLDIKDDVLLECSKYGLVTHIFVDKNSAGHVYIRFESQTAAVQAQRALHGRWFAGKMISTSFLTPQTYETKFPESR